ncbi:MAG: hypothetical protein ABJA82_16785, partial [Myxococcales bacterium]
MIFFAIPPVLAIVAVFSVTVAPPTAPEAGCPSARQVTEAMEVRFPTLLAPPALAPTDPNQGGSVPRGDVLRSVLDVAADGTVIRFSLVDARGDTQLRRILPAPARAKLTSECLALADTVAAIVERYLATITYDAPDGPPASQEPAVAETVRSPPPPGPPVDSTLAQRRRAISAGAGVSWRTTTGGGPQQDGLEVRVGGQVELTRGFPRLSALLNVGAAPGITTDIPPDLAPDLAHSAPDATRSATLRRFPLRVGVLVALPAGPGFVEPGVQGGADVILLSSTAGDGAPAASRVRFGPVVEAGVGYRLRLAGAFFLR